MTEEKMKKASLFFLCAHAAHTLYGAYELEGSRDGEEFRLLSGAASFQLRINYLFKCLDSRSLRDVEEEEQKKSREPINGGRYIIRGRRPSKSVATNIL